jgi:DNA-binding CsgD family transcriptional regulator
MMFGEEHQGSERMSLLSTQQEMIVKLAAHGLTNKEIARNLNVGVRAIETQFVRMRRKLGSANKTETIAEAMSRITAKTDEETAALADVTRWMHTYLIAFDSQFRIVFMNQACRGTFDFAIHDIDAGREVWKAITPGMADRERLRPLSSGTVRDYSSHKVTMNDSNGISRTIVWSSGAHSHPAKGWAWWAVGWEG